MCQLHFAGLLPDTKNGGDEQQIDHSAAGIPSWQITLQYLPRFGVFCPGEQAVAVDRTPQGLWLAPQGVDTATRKSHNNSAPDTPLVDGMHHPGPI
jgi:hypothetical protein